MGHVKTSEETSPEKSITILEALADSIVASVLQTASAHINLRIASPPSSEDGLFQSFGLG
jgi:hypothetical protein